MDQGTKKALDGILDTYSAKRETIKTEATKKQTERELFLEHFAEIAKTVIRPHFEQVGAHLKERGHDFRIREEKERLEPDGKRLSNEGIEFQIYPEGKRPGSSDHCPHVAFTVDSFKNTVFVHESTMMHARDRDICIQLST